MMVAKTNPAVKWFLIFGMIIGFTIIVIGEVSAVSDFLGGTLTGFEIISIDQDPITGEIRGNIVLGRPELSGVTWTGAPNTEGFAKSSTCPLRTTGFSSSQLQTNSPTSFGTGAFSGGCTAGFAEWNLSELPDDLTITSMVFKLKDQKWFGFLTEPSNRNCKIGIIEQPVLTITRSQLFQKFNAPDFILQDGDWCTTSGEKSFIVSQTVIDAFNRAIIGDDLMTLSFSMSTLAKGTGCCWEANESFWATEGSWVINGFSEPIQCAVGEHQVGFKCEPLICDEGFKVNGNICSQIQCPLGQNLIGSICTPIECNVGQRLVGNFCENIICPVGNTLIGSTCEAIICEEGFTLSGNTCTVISCPMGTQLDGSSCNPISCPIGTTLEANDCNPIICQTGTFLDLNTCVQIECGINENLIGNICTPIECQVGQILVDGLCETIQCEIGNELIGSECLPINCLSTEQLVGNECQPKPLNCPIGTQEQNNVCVQFVPQLPAFQAMQAPVNLLTVTGILIFVIAFGGFVVRAIVRRGF